MTTEKPEASQVTKVMAQYIRGLEMQLRVLHREKDALKLELMLLRQAIRASRALPEPPVRTPTGTSPPANVGPSTRAPTVNLHVKKPT